MEGDLFSCLSPELLARILFQLEQGVEDGSCLHIAHPKSLCEAQAEFFRLRFVCRQFRDAFKTEPVLSRGLALPDSLYTQQLPSLLDWMQNHGSLVQFLAAYCGSSCLEAALGAMRSHCSLLSSVFFYNLEMQAAVALLSSFTTLTMCELVSPHEHISLTPLQALPQLQKLVLTDGKFSCEHLPFHLTNLLLDECDMAVSRPSACMTLLQKLRVMSSKLVLNHPFGLEVCQSLRVLSISRCMISAADPEDRLVCCSGVYTRIPSGFSALTSLLDLYVHVAGNSIGPEFDIGCLCSLTLLQSLQVLSEVDNIIVPSGLTAMQHLSYMSLCNGAQDATEWYVRLDVDWNKMLGLQMLQFRGVAVFCTDSILGLSQLRRLQGLHLDECWPHDDEFSFRYLALLLYRLAKYCPHVTVSIDKEFADTNPIEDVD